VVDSGPCRETAATRRRHLSQKSRESSYWWILWTNPSGGEWAQGCLIGLFFFFLFFTLTRGHAPTWKQTHHGLDANAVVVCC
jgi:hypothetical protein